VTEHCEQHVTYAGETYDLALPQGCYDCRKAKVRADSKARVRLEREREAAIRADLRRPNELRIIAGLEVIWHFDDRILGAHAGNRFASVAGHSVATVSLGEHSLAYISLRFKTIRYGDDDTWVYYYHTGYPSVREAELSAERDLERNAASVLSNIRALAKEPTR
jgi:hypothetical protein